MDGCSPELEHVLFFLAILPGTRWNLEVVLSYIFRMPKDVEQVLKLHMPFLFLQILMEFSLPGLSKLPSVKTMNADMAQRKKAMAKR